MSESAIPWTVACQAPLSMEFSRQEYWSGLTFPSPGDLPNPGIKPGSPELQVVAQTVKRLSTMQETHINASVYKVGPDCSFDFHLHDENY